jgi:integrase
MLALSGARKGEIEKLTWREVDLRTGLLRLAPQRRAGGVRRRPSSPERVSENLRLATDHTQTPSGPHIARLKVGPGSPASLGPNRIEACERTGAFAKRNAVPNTLANAPLLS